MAGVLVLRAGDGVDGADERTMAAAVAAARRHLASAAGAAVVFDFDDVPYISEEAVAALLHLLNDTRRGAPEGAPPRLALAALGPPVVAKLRRMQILNLFATYLDAGTAQTAFETAG
jgi:anti-anti-sigma regulatory factor